MSPLWTPFDQLASLYLNAPGWGMIILFGIGILPAIIARFVDAQKQHIHTLLWRLCGIGVALAFGFSWVFMGFINPIAVGASYIQKVDDLCVVGNTAIAIDTMRIPDTDGNTGYTFRVHGFNLPSQTRTFRRIFRDPIALLGIQDTTVWIQTERGRLGLDINTGKTQQTVSAPVSILDLPQDADAFTHTSLPRLYPCGGQRISDDTRVPVDARAAAIHTFSRPQPPLTHTASHNTQPLLFIGGTIVGIDQPTGNVAWTSLW
jgi:hypothetical protein